MVLSLVIGLLLLAAFILLSRWFATASPGRVLRAATWTGATLLITLGAFLAATGRLGWAIAALAGAIPWVTRALRTHALLRTLRSYFGGRQTARPSSGSKSEIETSLLRMALDHDTGAMEGVILSGPFQGRPLSALTRSEFLVLWQQSQAEPQSAQLLAAWADRMQPGWRDAAEEVSGGAGQAERATSMSRDEAYEILGLQPGASNAEIRAAHRRLMSVVHPDRGGSTYLAARINQAKDLLTSFRG